MDKVDSLASLNHNVSIQERKNINICAKRQN